MSDDSTTPHDHPADAVVPPPPPADMSIPDAVIPPPPSEASIPDAVIPPPPPESLLPSTRRSRPKPPVLAGDQPASTADDWTQPSVAPEVPTSGGYRALTFVIFTFLFVLLAAAVAVAVFLATTTLGSSTAAGVVLLAEAVRGG